MAKKIIKGGWLDCIGSGNKYSCTLTRSEGHIIENKGGKFTVEKLRFDELNTRAGLLVTHTKVTLNPGTDKIIECEILDKSTTITKKDVAYCEILR